MIRVLMSVLRLSPGEASRRVRAAAALGGRTSMLGQPVPPRRPPPRGGATGRPGGPRNRCRSSNGPSRRSTGAASIPPRSRKGNGCWSSTPKRSPSKTCASSPTRSVDRIDPDGTEPKDQLNHDRRHVEFHQRGDGSWAGTLRLTSSLGTKLQAVLGPLAKPRLNQTVTGRTGGWWKPRTNGITGSGCTTPSKMSATGCSALTPCRSRVVPRPP